MTPNAYLSIAGAKVSIFFDAPNFYGKNMRKEDLLLKKTPIGADCRNWFYHVDEELSGEQLHPSAPISVSAFAWHEGVSQCWG
ncbi:hypothetical protein [uncultured Bacteroides sp.]|uniref:hypothetical protein n=1 Tax=uncultured Bacteroides sp. TaxID=162156 RepID=UPI002611BFB4|nr:hypothetical protein [uncultured Bacteroides sp.]